MEWVWTVALFGSLALSAYAVARFGLGLPAGSARTLGSIVLAWSWLSLGMEGLGQLGWLTRPFLLGWTSVGLLAALPWVSGRDRPPASPPVKSIGWGISGVLALGLALWATAVLLPPSLLYPVKVVSDGPIYHLYFASRWWKSGGLELVAAPFGENAATYFPAVGDLWFTALMIAWGGDRLAKIGQAPFLLVSAITAYALARRLGAGRPASMLATCWFATCSVFMLFSFEANVDTVFVAGYLLSAYFLTRYALGDDTFPSLLLAGLSAGCALGTKAPAVVFVPPLIGLGMVLAWQRGSGTQQKSLGAATVLLSPLVVAGYWYARNAVLTGNPLYPLHLEVFGRVVLRGWYGAEVMRLSPYYIPVTDLLALGDTLLAVLDPREAPVWLVAVAGLWAIGRGRNQDEADRRVDRWVWVMAGLAVLNIALYWLVVPYRTQQRFMFQAIGVAVVPLARLFDRSQAWRAIGVTILAVHVVTDQGWPFVAPGQNPPWDLSPFIPNATPGLVPLPITHLGSAPFQVLLVSTFTVVGMGAGALTAAWLWSRCGARSGKGPRIWALLTTAAFLGTVCALSTPWGLDDRLRFFPPFREYYRGWLAFDQACGPRGARVAYAGTDLPFFLQGNGLRNTVRYVNVDEHRDWLPHDYHLDAIAHGGPATWPHPRPGWDRVHPDYAAWLENLRAEGIQWLVVTRANPDEGPHNVADPLGYTIERVWAEAHPEIFERVYGLQDRDPLFQLYRVRP